VAEYALTLSESEVMRYRFMAEGAFATEKDLWSAAGIAEGARMADVGCGPGAVSVLLGRLAGPVGEVWAVDNDAGALSLGEALAKESELTNVRFREADVAATGLEPGVADVVMMRHVLAHNGGREDEIVAHLATLIRPGGCVYLVDIEADAIRMRPDFPEFARLNAAYRELHARQGNDLSVGLRLGELLTAAGLETIEFTGRYQIVRPTAGIQSPAWAARDRLLSEGLATSEEVAEWGALFDRIQRQRIEITIFLPQFVAIGRRPA
jgi:ubiquinone/menaquinone biosynthesis C-methylase UbiE